MINVALALIDIMAGIVLSASGLPYLPANGFVITLAAVVIIKGFWYVIMSWGNRNEKGQEFYEGWLDLVSGLLIVAVYLGYPFSLFAIPGVILIINGAWYLIKGLTE